MKNNKSLCNMMLLLFWLRAPWWQKTHTACFSVTFVYWPTDDWQPSMFPCSARLLQQTEETGRGGATCGQWEGGGGAVTTLRSDASRQLVKSQKTLAGRRLNSTATSDGTFVAVQTKRESNPFSFLCFSICWGSLPVGRLWHFLLYELMRITWHPAPPPLGPSLRGRVRGQAGCRSRRLSGVSAPWLWNKLAEVILK